MNATSSNSFPINYEYNKTLQKYERLRDLTMFNWTIPSETKMAILLTLKEFPNDVREIIIHRIIQNLEDYE